MSNRRLVRLFPRIWRERYGGEFEALLESSRLTRRDVADVVRRAAGEWIAHTMIGRIILGTVLAASATVLAAGLTALTPVDVAQQNWPIVTLVAFGLLDLGMSCRFLWCALMRERILAREQTAWMTALFVTSIATQWGARVVLTAATMPGIAMLVAMWTIFVQSSMQTMAMSRILPHGQVPHRLRKGPAARPLGLI